MSATTFEFVEVPLGELLSNPLRNGLTRPKRVRGSGVPMVNMGELFSHRRIGDVEMERVPLNDRNPGRDLLEPLDLLFARQSIVAEGAGKVSIFLGANEPVTFESHLIRARVDEAKADPMWVFYFFESSVGRDRVRSIVNQTSAAGIRGSDLIHLPVPCPDLDHQRRGAACLRILDDKIDSNRRLSKALARFAHAEFRRMFGGHLEGTGRLGDHVVAIRGRSYKSSELADSERALVTLKSVRRGGGYSAAGLKPYTGDFKPEQVVQPGELVVAHTDLTQRAEVIGKPAIVPDRGGFSELVASLDLAIVRPADDRISVPFLFHLLLEPAFQQHAYGFANGSTVLHLNKEAIPSFPIDLPDSSRLNAYDDIAVPLMRYARCLEAETQTLGHLRDALLPKLVSGAIRVPDSADPTKSIEPVVEEHMG